ncbi:hypothetical protein CALVIDRAFT_530325 [Calocera viscosa TUFC12733]|uniref:Uncharacterized protein n=1 Tax=Calocera viscosa (strain TUFC12733) TaxID=1330018 RepID=A0A167I1B4_CALVF|nr:hypothetical protein CALVIDRAFT_530325 [Calocera viscosa TUFC12733]
MSAASSSHTSPRNPLTEPIVKHVDVYLEGDQYLRACIEAAGTLGVPATQYALNEAISFRIAEQEIHRSTWICCLCEDGMYYTTLGFQHHVCSYRAAVMTATILKHTVPQRYAVADSLTALRYLKTGTQRADNPWALLMWKLLTQNRLLSVLQHIVTLFLTRMNEVDLPMRRILNEELLEQSIIAGNHTRETIETLVRELEVEALPQIHWPVEGSE